MLDTKALVEAMAPVIREAIDAARAPLLERLDAQDREIAALKARAPERGEPGSPGEPGERGLDGKDGAAGEAGVGLAGAVIDRDGVLHLTLTNGEVKALGHVVGRDGVDGKDGDRGEAGFGLEDFAVELKADGRTVALSFSRGDVAVVRELPLPTMIYRGVYAEGRDYELGDTVTWAGSLWHCDAPTSEKPGEGAKAWTLAAKRGRDGKDFAGPQERAVKPVRV